MRVSGSRWAGALICLAVLLSWDTCVRHRGAGHRRPERQADAEGGGDDSRPPGAVYTDADGRFSWKPDLTPPVRGAGHSARRAVHEAGAGRVDPGRRPARGPDLAALVDETVTVTAGTAPDIEATMANATTLLPSQEIQNRQPANLTQALETVAGVSTVSEGHAAVPAIRGLARGRTLILLDGARVTSDRRVGPSATFLDPFVLDGIEIARGPGSVAYGSDAFGGVIYARTRRVDPASPLAGRVVGAVGAGEPQGRVGAEISKGLGKGGVALQAHYRDFDDYRSPQGEVFNSGATDQGFLARGEYRARQAGCSAPAGRATSAVTSTGRGPTPRPSGSTTPSKTRIASRRCRTPAGGRFRAHDRQHVRRQLPSGDSTRTASPPPRAGASSKRPITMRTTIQVRASAERLSRARDSRWASTSTGASTSMPPTR